MNAIAPIALPDLDDLEDTALLDLSAECFAVGRELAHVPAWRAGHVRLDVARLARGLAALSDTLNAITGGASLPVIDPRTLNGVSHHVGTDTPAI